ncbi:MAG TPA: UDP-N-acetylglucosamine 1-carboxyvinyltransferase, partial [Membranihabitans sp.]|nr:UDP-N-acetylglucosamine 1-carboxyvinyltransferase [Membranihabitans sp.]
ATFEYDESHNSYFLSGENLKGTYVLMDEISVTGTANMLMASALTPGVTTIYNAACEPYVQKLSKMLVRMGANISGIGSNLLTVQGVEELNGTEHTISPDMIEIGSFIGMAAMTGSDLEITDVDLEELGNIPDTFEKIGVKIEPRGNSILVRGSEPYEIQKFIDGSILTIYDSPWPGFTPDLMSIVLVVAVQAKGSVLIHQKMFESRLFFVDKLIDMGAQIILCDPHRATVIGMARESRLRGIEMSSPDIRAGVALLIAALSAEGESVIHNVQQIDRGYQFIDQRLQALGAKIERVNTD